MQVIWVKREGEYFFEEDWTSQIALIAKEIFPFSSFRGARIANPESGLSCAKKRIPMTIQPSADKNRNACSREGKRPSSR
jgi:hypothetical protein